MTVSSVEPPPEAFNFAAHLLAANVERPDKAAFIDDVGVVTYGEFDERARRFAAGLKEAGIKREERVLILMQDGADWPVAFLGALLTGVAPVAVNTLMTADDLAYMLEHSRAQAAFVSGAVKPTLKAALTKSDHEVHTVVVSRPAAPLEFGEVEFEDFLGRQAPLMKPARTHADDPAFWLYSSGSTGRPKGTVHSHANPYWTTELYGKAILGLRESDVCFSAAKLFFAYGLGNALTFPLAVGATALLMAERPTPEAVFKRLTGGVGGVKPTVFYGAPTGFAGILASPACLERKDVALRLVSSAGEALPAEIGERFKRHFGVDIVDGIGSTEMLHIFLSNRPDRVRYGTTGWPVPGYEVELRGEDGRARSGRRAGRSLHPRALGRADVLGQSREDPRDLPGRLDQEWRQVYPQFRRLVHLRRPLRRHAEGRRDLGEPVRGRSDAGAAPVRPGGRGHRRARRRRPYEDQGLRRPEAWAERDRRRPQALRQGPPRPVQIPARHRVHRRTAQDRHGQDPALPLARAGGGRG